MASGPTAMALSVSGECGTARTAEAAILADALAYAGPMKVKYVVLYVNDAAACRSFWVDRIGMVEKASTDAGGVTISQVGFADQSFAFELVPLELMRDNPDGLDLATPSIAFQVEDLQVTHRDLAARGVQVTDVGDHSGTPSFAFSDNEGRWFAVTA